MFRLKCRGDRVDAPNGAFRQPGKVHGKAHHGLDEGRGPQHAGKSPAQPLTPHDVFPALGDPVVFDGFTPVFDPAVDESRHSRAIGERTGDAFTGKGLDVSGRIANMVFCSRLSPRPLSQIWWV